MTATLRARLGKLEARRRDGDMSALSDADLARIICDGWEAMFASGEPDDDTVEILRATARSFRVEPVEMETPASLWGRLRPVLENEAGC